MSVKTQAGATAVLQTAPVSPPAPNCSVAGMLREALHVTHSAAAIPEVISPKRLFFALPSCTPRDAALQGPQQGHSRDKCG